MSDLNDVRFFATAPHDCSYLDDQIATTLFADPDVTIADDDYQTLTLLGFRRSGKYFYRPQCSGCRACISVRIPVAEFVWTRRFRKTMKANTGMTAQWQLPYIDNEIYDLYSRYINTRHPDGDMHPPSREQFRTFLMIEGPNTRFLCFRDPQGQLVAVCVIDVLEQHGLSAIYTFFDPDQPKRSLGRLGILTQILEAQRLCLPYVYLGYWIEECEKMRYKTEYRPIELLQGKTWERQQG
ncbi:MAG: arginyltransferase [Litorivicinus sp.]